MLVMLVSNNDGDEYKKIIESSVSPRQPPSCSNVFTSFLFNDTTILRRETSGKDIVMVNGYLNVIPPFLFFVTQMGLKANRKE